MENNYQEIKDLNPNFNFLVRPHPDVGSTIVARYGLFGRPYSCWCHLKTCVLRSLSCLLPIVGYRIIWLHRYRTTFWIVLCDLDQWLKTKSSTILPDYGAKETVDVTDKTEDEVAKEFEFLVDKGKLMRRSNESKRVVWDSVAEL